MSNTIKKTIIVIGITLWSLLYVVLMYIGGFIIYNATYTNFCDLRGANQRWISQTIDITDNTYRLGGIGNIGIGSTRREIERAVSIRNTLTVIFGDNVPPSGYRYLSEPHALPDSTLGFFRTRTWNAIEFVFDENDKVIKIRITPMF